MAAPRDQFDKFVYSDPSQIRVNKREDREPLRDLRTLIEDEDLDPGKVLDLVRDHVGELRRDRGTEA